jgi:hypothetical protein
VSRGDKWLRDLTANERVKRAESKTNILIDRISNIINLNEQNKIIVHSDILSKQIPISYAANSFNLFQKSIQLYEIIRLCALWDCAAEDRVSIPTIVALIDDDDVMSILRQNTASNWTKNELINHTQFGAEQAEKASRGLKRTIKYAKIVTKSNKFELIKDFRDIHIAHNLSLSNKENAGIDTKNPTIASVETLYGITLKLSNYLHIGINNAGYTFDASKEMYRSHAELLWTGCTFKVLG